MSPSPSRGAVAERQDAPSNDPLCAFLREELQGRPRSTVVLVEPVAEYFERLQKGYEALPGVQRECVAIAEQDCERDFYRLGVDPAEYGHPEWLSQLGSLHATRMTEMWNRYEKGLMASLGETADLKAFWLKCAGSPNACGARPCTSCSTGMTSHSSTCSRSIPRAMTTRSSERSISPASARG